MQKPVLGKIKGIHLDLSQLSRLHEPYITIWKHRFNLKMAVDRYNNEQELGWGNDASYGVHRQLLYGTFDRRSE